MVEESNKKTESKEKSKVESKEASKSKDGESKQQESNQKTESKEESKEKSNEKPSRLDTGIRLLFVILFALVYSAAEIVVLAVVVIQFGFVLVTGDRNPKLLDFGANLSKFVYQILQFGTFVSDRKPFPFSDWPSTDEKGESSDPTSS